MGIFKNVYKKIKIEEEAEKENIRREIFYLNENEIQLQHTKLQSKFGQFYDTTRFLVNKNEVRNVDGGHLYKCKVSWLNSEQDMTNEEFQNVANEILVGFDFKLLIEDIEYRDIVMEKLLDKSNVEKYLQRAMDKNAEEPCRKLYWWNASYIKFNSIL